jgi:ABC-type dipeptide/oligopeptide/nickel transport system permease subunit
MRTLNAGELLKWVKLRPALSDAGRGNAWRTLRAAVPPAAFSPHLWVGGALVLGVILTAALAPMLAPSAPDLMQGALRLHTPSLAHPFGADQFGRDLFSRVLYGARVALWMSLAATLLGGLPGTVLGLWAGYHCGWGEHVLSRVMDAWLAFPGLLLAIILVARLGPSLTTTIIALGIMGIPWFYRLMRGAALSARSMAYVEAARALGASDSRILAHHILPNVATSLIVLGTLRLGTVLLAAGGLGFIGLGAQPPQAEWGALLAAGREYMGSAWWLTAFPGLALTLTVMGFNLLGDGLRDALSPTQRTTRITPPELRG